MKEPTLLRRLEAHGLSPTSARAYVALFSLGKADAATVAKAARIPKGKVHQTLRALNEHALASIHAGSPLLFEARPISHLFARLREAGRERLLALDAEEPEMTALLARETLDRPVKPGRVRAFHGRQNAAEVIREVILSAERTIDAIVCPVTGPAPHHYLPLLARAHDNGVRLRIVLPDPPGGATTDRLTSLGARIHAGASEGARGVMMFVADEDAAALVHAPALDERDAREDLTLSFAGPPAAALADLAQARWSQCDLAPVEVVPADDPATP